MNCLKRMACVVAGVLLSTAVAAAPITFNFRFASDTTPAQAVGTITFEDSLLLNPGFNDIDLPDASVLALYVTVTGATAGNGTFDLSDFCQIYFDTGESALDFNQPLVGQVNASGTWGPTGTMGDFNLFGSCDESEPDSTPQGVDPFVLGADGGNADAMELASMSRQIAAASVPVPALDARMLLLLAAMLGLGGAWYVRRQRHA